MKSAQRLALATVAATLVLIVVGVIVRASGSGLGCPDWPLCHGGAVPPAQEKAWIEFSHRFVATIVGFMVIALAILAVRHYRHVPTVLWAAVITVPLVGIQGLLGAITVVRELPAEIVATHLVVAMTILGFELFVAIGMVRADPDNAGRLPLPRGARTGGGIIVATILWLAVTMWIGAYMTESGAATACTDWPACNGANIFPGADDHEITHMGHRYLAGALIVFWGLAIVRLSKRRNDAPWAPMLMHAAAGLWVVQVLVGALNVWYTFPDTLTVLHTAIATAIWTVLVSAAILWYYRPAVRGAASLSAAEVPA